MPLTAQISSTERQEAPECRDLVGLALVACALIVGSPIYATEDERFGMQMENKLSLEIQGAANPFGATLDHALARRHAGLLQQAVIDLTAYPEVRFQVKVVPLPGITDAAKPEGLREPTGAGVSSPWLSVSSDAPGIVDLELYVSELRVIFDKYVADTPAARKSYIHKTSFDPVSTACMSDLGNLYSEAVSSGHEVPETLFQATCLDPDLGPPFLALFQSAPQNFFGPFDYVVREHLKHVQVEIEGFYQALYPALLEHGLAELRSGAAPDPDWWRAALDDALH